MPGIYLTYAAENQYWLTASPKQSFYVYVELSGGIAPQDTARVPLNLSIVLDRSGSMAGEKIEYAKKAAAFLIDNLGPDDHLSLVQYDDVVDVVIPSGPAQNKEELKRRLAQIEARNMTNLSGGMLEGYAQVQATQKVQYVNRVLLLSDGLANRGVVDPKELQRIAQAKFREQGIGLSTFGVGADFNELLMTNLSEYGGGNYYFIDNPDAIPGIFAKELKGLLAVVAQNVKLKLDIPARYFRCEKVYGFPADIKTNNVQVSFNDVFSGERKTVLIKLIPLETIAQDIYLPLSVVYEDVLATFAHSTENVVITIRQTDDEAAVKSGINYEVTGQIALFVSNEMFEQVVMLMDKRDEAGARAKIEEIQQYLEAHLQNMPVGDVLSDQYKRIQQIREELESQDWEIKRYERRMSFMMKEMTPRDFAMYQKNSRYNSYERMKKKGREEEEVEEKNKNE